MSKKALVYEDPAVPGSLGGVQPFAKASGLSTKKAQQLLQQKLSYTLHKPRRRRFPTLPTLVFGMNEQWQIDLADLQSLAKWNKGYKYLITVIDVFSKFAWAEPIKSKSGQQVKQGLERLWKRAHPRKPLRVQTDAGTEFYNSKVQAFFKEQDVGHFSTYGDAKAAVVERWNRTLKEKMFRYFTAKNTLKYIDILQSLVHAYNHTRHSSIKEKPVNVNESNENTIWNRLYGARLSQKPKKAPKCQIGDKVRLNKKHRPFKKGYLPGWTEEVFLVREVKRHPLVTYKLTEYDGTPIKGTFYEQDVQNVHVSDESLFRVEKVLKRKGKQVFVKWKGWPKKYNSWVAKQDLQVLG